MPDEAIAPVRRPRPVLLPTQLSDDGPWLPRLRKLILAALCVHVTLALVSGYRAWVQVFDLALVAPARLAPGTTVRADALISARTHVRVWLELRQGDRVDTLGAHTIPGNRDGGYDPRPRRGSLRVLLGPHALDGFAPGPARLRATALGRSQWLRTPPPTIREVDVELAPAPTTTVP